MDIELIESFDAQMLDDEGDPVGKELKLPPGMYRLRSGLTQQEDGLFSAWVEARSGRLYQAYNLKPSI